jgi:hypothetical protein
MMGVRFGVAFVIMSTLMSVCMIVHVRVRMKASTVMVEMHVELAAAHEPPK